jgi:PAS domain S-box-containing protein
MTAVRIDINYSFMYVAYIRDLRKEREDSDLINTLYEESPVFIDIWDEQFNLLDCNKRVTTFFGVSSKNEYINNFEKFIPGHQPCGRPSAEMHSAYFDKILRDGSARFDWLHIDASGNELPVKAHYIRLIRNGKPIIVGFNHDLRET